MYPWGKSERTRIVIISFHYFFIEGVEKIVEKQREAEKRDVDFYYFLIDIHSIQWWTATIRKKVTRKSSTKNQRGLRHFKLHWWFNKNSCITFLLFYYFFGDKKRIACESSMHLPQIYWVSLSVVWRRGHT